MQLYQFDCPACGHTFRRIFSDARPDATTCPRCGGIASSLAPDENLAIPAQRPGNASPRAVSVGAPPFAAVSADLDCGDGEYG